MKKFLLIIGILIVIFGLFPLMRYALDYTELSNYGKGFIWGKVIIVLVGTILITISRRLKS